MASEQAPVAAVFHECIGKLKLEIERFAAGDSFRVRLPGHNRGATVDAHFHVVILEDFVFRIVVLCLGKVVSSRGDVPPLGPNSRARSAPLRSTLGSAPGGRDPEGLQDTNMIVVDTNVICFRWVSSPNSAAAESALAKDPHWIEPVLWRSEFRNVLALAIRQKTLTIDAAQEIARKAETSFERREFAVSSDAVLRLVMSNCTAYDCEFVALAQIHQVPLVTVDRQVLREFPRTAISLERFVRQ